MALGIVLAAVEATPESGHVWQRAQQVGAGASLRCISVIKPATAIYADLNFAPLLECTADWQQEIMRAQRGFFIDTLQGLTDEQLTIVEGIPGLEICNAAQAADADLIVMGVHGRRGLQKLMGSTTHSVLNHTLTNVLAVHPDSGDGPYQRVLIAVDTTDLLTDVLTAAQPYLAQASQSQVLTVMLPLHQVFAAPYATGALDWSFEELARDIETETRSKISKALSQSGLDPATLKLVQGDPREEIVRAAQSFDADLLVIGSNQRSAINRLLLGSTARAVLDRTPCDTLVVRPRES